MELKPFDKDECELCGKCLAACPHLDLNENQAKAEMERLHKGDLNSPVLKACVSCFMCNAACPNGQNVHGLVLSLWHRNRSGLSLPGRVRMCQPEQKLPNVWSAVWERYSKREKKMFADMGRDYSGKEVLFLGCNQLLNPYIADSPLLNGLPIAAAQGVCCGEMYFRMGFLDSFRMSAQRWMDYWSRRAPERMVVFCTACLNMFRNVYPAYLNAKVPFEIVGLLEWLSERIDIGNIKLTDPVGLKVLVQDSCHARVLGPEFMATARTLMEKAGAKVIDTARDDMGTPCCGMAGAAPGFNPYTMYRLGRGRLRLARKTGANAIAAYCNGCVLMLSMTTQMTLYRPEVYHLIELLEMACGHRPAHLHRRRAREIMVSALSVAGRKFSSPSTNVLELEEGERE